MKFYNYEETIANIVSNMVKRFYSLEPRFFDFGDIRLIAKRFGKDPADIANEINRKFELEVL